MGSPKMREGFPQNSPWKKAMVPETDVGIDEQDVQISMELKMLIAIVQEQSTNTESSKCDLTRTVSIFSNENGDAVKGLSHQEGFIT